MHELEQQNRRLLLQRGESPLEASSPERADAQAVPADRKGGADQRDDAAARRERHRQGTAGARAARAESARRRPLRRDQLRGHPENLLESELFGYEKGAFTGAAKRTGARSSTPTAARCSSTRSAICRCRCRPSCCASCRSASSSAVGGRTRFRSTCGRLCHQPGPADVHRRRRFREDLFYRISEVTCDIPPLARARRRRRRAGARVPETVSRSGTVDRCAASPPTRCAIESYNWPGNVRELENKINRAVIMAEGKHVTAEIFAERRANQPPDEPACGAPGGRAQGVQPSAGV